MGSEMCIRDSSQGVRDVYDTRCEAVAFGGDADRVAGSGRDVFECCLLYTSDAADERSSVDLGGRRIIKKKKESNCIGRSALV